MNYRHAFHAGNHADVLKHAVLALIMAHLVKKPTPFRVLDVFAGIGVYDLASDEAARSPEWQDGIGRLFSVENVPAALEPWLGVVRSLNPDEVLRYYPGSPEIARHFLRREDRLMLADLHPVEAERVAERYASERRIKVENRDGWEAVRAWLPPPERRGLIVIDPPFELAGEYDRLIAALENGLSRFATGTFLLWHAVKDLAAVAQYEAELAQLDARILRAELAVRDPSGRGLGASGLVIVNPPWTLEADLEVLLPWLAETLGQGPGAGWALDRLAGSF